MRLREDVRQLVRADSTCAVQTDGIVGNAFTQISVGTDGASPVAPGDTIAGIDPIEFAVLIQEGRDTFRTVVREVIDVKEDVSAAGRHTGRHISCCSNNIESTMRGRGLEAMMLLEQVGANRLLASAWWPSAGVVVYSLRLSLGAISSTLRWHRPADTRVRMSTISRKWLREYEINCVKHQDAR